MSAGYDRIPAVLEEPAVVYNDRLAAHRSVVERLEQLDARFAYARLGVVIAALAAAFLIWRTAIPPWILLVLAATFLVLMAGHDRTIRARRAAGRAIGYYERGLARIEDRWIGTGEPGSHFLDEHHPYAADLNLFGAGSLFELLSTARTNVGEEELARWLLAGAPADVIVARQQAAAELAQALTLREAMATAGETATISLDASGLREWAGQDALRSLGHLRLATYGLSVALASAAVVVAFTGSLLALQILFVSQLVWRYSIGDGLERVIRAAGGKASELNTLSQLFLHLESASLLAPRLIVLRGMLAAHPTSASRAIRSLQRLSERHEWAHNLPLVPVILFFYGVSGAAWAIDASLIAAAAVLLVDPFLALAVERWRRVHGRHVESWIGALAEFEALTALAAYHFEQPQDPFPVIAADSATPAAVFEGVSLGHPLVPRHQMVRNDVTLSSGMQLLVVSGSNMSGKSTLLRTVGVNAVLALAGAPVRAAALRMSPLSIAATLRIQDSLLEGRSRFFAEITRIRVMVDLANGPVPLLFLIDEMLHGTNSQDRRAGSAGILRALLARGAIGLITTHDLALTTIADALAPRAANVHFDDTFEGGEIRFDYRVKPGPVTRTNGLALMRAVGLTAAPARFGGGASI